ncbi:hypothetical protein LshimejAT787_3200090 [Lyophyllum shimeji]|uniref:Uncharacterized protein n=1 Tax=Lyophyllum shimeji TaxID=47721 RepID=A0A9P3Q1C7_LYOSH|nr:hypothetical protein LshimejAT787_3200090 [Lyophyllum shimeji]
MKLHKTRGHPDGRNWSAQGGMRADPRRGRAARWWLSCHRPHKRPAALPAASTSPHVAATIHVSKTIPPRTPTARASSHVTRDQAAPKTNVVLLSSRSPARVVGNSFTWTLRWSTKNLIGAFACSVAAIHASHTHSSQAPSQQAPPHRRTSAS